MNKSSSSQNFRRVLTQVDPSEFIGRKSELDRILARVEPESPGRGLLLLMEPAAGVSELLRQAYDEIFNDQTTVIPIYFAFNRNDTTAVSSAIEFLTTFLQQYIAFRRKDPSIAQSTLTLPQLPKRALAADRDWIEKVVELYNSLRFSKDDQALVRFCLSAPRSIPADHGRPLIMLDGAQLAQYLNGVVPLGTEVLRVFGRGGVAFVLAGLRRQILEATIDAGLETHMFEHLHVTQLKPEEASQLVEQVARRHDVRISDMAQDLLVQQFGGSPFFINMFLQRAREKGVKLISHLDCERLYVEELFGSFSNYFENLMEEICPPRNTRLLLIATLWEALSGKTPVASFEAWEKQLNLSAAELEEMLNRLHMHEFVNWEGRNIQTGTGPQIWKDYLKIRYQLDVENKPRALVFARTLTETLKRAPDAMNRQRIMNRLVNLGKVVAGFNGQQVPRVLFENASFSRKYKGETPQSVAAGLETEQMMKLPQTVHSASCANFKSEMRDVCEEQRCFIAHTFEAGNRYSDAQEVVWLVAYLHEKDTIDIDAPDVRKWCERFAALVEEFGFGRHQIWLIANSGFTDQAIAVLETYAAFSSNAEQFALLSGRISETPRNPGVHNSEAEEFRLEMPFGADNELIAAGTVEQIARRLPFGTDAINQIKMAVVEACINVFEHSFSPDQKILQRFRLESDRLVVTISSRGVVPTNLNGTSSRSDTTEAAEARRGYGLILIRSLMDEVEFEPVDDGTSLRMTKYIRDTAS